MVYSAGAVGVDDHIAKRNLMDNTVTPVLGIVYLQGVKRYLKEEIIYKLIGHLKSSYDVEAFEFNVETLQFYDVPSWPRCDAFLCLDRDSNYPNRTQVLARIDQYIALHKPFILNPQPLREKLRSRSWIYRRLNSIGIQTPEYAIYDPLSTIRVVREDRKDSVKIGKHVIKRPFIEKPIKTDSHDIVIYHANGKGSTVMHTPPEQGTQVYHSENNSIRTDGPFIYEEFLPNALEVKIKIIGADFACGECRPTTDKGVAERTAIELTPMEIEITKKLQGLVQQDFFGFDVLRYRGESYVIDVNDQAFLPKVARPEFIEKVAMYLGRRIEQHVGIVLRKGGDRAERLTSPAKASAPAPEDDVGVSMSD